MMEKNQILRPYLLAAGLAFNNLHQMGPAKRGQRAKKKKIKEKYADQDEDERRMRMEILAVSCTLTK